MAMLVFCASTYTKIHCCLTRHLNVDTTLGENQYKVRLAIKSKGKGKSGGARVIIYLVKENEEIYLLTIYDKEEVDNVSDSYLRQIVRD